MIDKFWKYIGWVQYKLFDVNEGRIHVEELKENKDKSVDFSFEFSGNNMWRFYWRAVYSKKYWYSKRLKKFLCKDVDYTYEGAILTMFIGYLLETGVRDEERNQRKNRS